MSTDSTRRSFLKLSVAGLAATATTGVAVSSNNAMPPAAGQVDMWVTDSQLHCTQAPPISWRPGAVSGSGITLNTEKKFQTMLGFGAAFTDASCYMFDQLAAPSREQLFHELFHPSAMGLNVCRNCMGASDYSTHVYSYDDDGPDPELQRFSIAHDKKYILPMLREARKLNPDLFLFSTPWSPPGWMKSGGSMLGGAMRHVYLPVYARYFLQYLKAYAAEGVPVQAITPQNEVDTDQDARMPACIWPQEYEIAFVAQLGPLLEQQDLSTKIWILDHNYNLWGRAICELDDAELRKYCGDVAWHGYAGSADMVGKVHDAHPNVAMHWTEGGPDYTNPDYLTDWNKWGHTFTEALRNWCESLTAWNFALDEQGRPNIGPFPCGGLVTIHSRTKEITRSGQFWAIAHFSRFIRRRARRFDSQSALTDVDHVGFENPDGQHVLVLSNRGGARDVTLQANGRMANVTMKQDSLATLVWS